MPLDSSQRHKPLFKLDLSMPIKHQRSKTGTNHSYSFLLCSLYVCQSNSMTRWCRNKNTVGSAKQFFSHICVKTEVTWNNTLMILNIPKEDFLF